MNKQDDPVRRNVTVRG